MAKHKFSELVDIPKLQESMDYFHKATGLVTAVLDTEENILVASGWTELCTKFHRCHSTTLARCKDSDAYIKAHLHEGEYVEYRCKNGLLDVAFPIILDGEHIATFFFGQFLYENEPPDMDFFKSQAEKLGFDIPKYMKAVQDISIIPEERVRNIIAYYKNIAALLTDMGLTQKKQLEINRELEMHHIELTKAKEAAEAASIAKSKFLSKMSHELRTPLNPIMGYAQIMKRQKNLTLEQKKQLQIVCESCAQLTDMIEDILEIARIDTYKETVEPAEFNLQGLIRAVVKDTQRKAEEKNLTVHYEQIDTLPEKAFGDIRMLYKLLLHLLDNAIKFTEHGAVTLRTSVVQDAKPGGEWRLRFEVADTGVGIPSENIDNIFTPFYQGEEVEGQLIEGAGLGLTLCRRLVELMGGRLTVQSPATTEGEIKGEPGSIFTVELYLG
jgi:signal transduction histidine kinase